ncbi:MAG: porin family protein [Alphaproteobacteria bacterium]|nr:porin family protein [Alphaproteobacteria bacterium]
MKRSIFAALGLLALAASVPASAADLPRGTDMPYKSPAYVAQYNWTGFYLGINGGGDWGDSSWNGFAVKNSPSGGMIGGTAGYNWQAPGSPWVFGLEGDIDWSSFKDSVACGASACETKNNWFGTVRGRVGFAFDRFMPYFTGGAAFGDIKANRVGFAGASDTNVGWTVGAGLEGVIAGNWTAKLEYLYADLGNTTCAAVSCGVATNVDLQVNILRGGLNYRF